MQEAVSFNKKKQKSFSSSVDNYKKLLKSGKLKIEENSPITKKKPALKERGVVYVSHIPHGFYEEEMKSYFGQFGVVTRIRLARSKKTGKSKGFAFIEFKEPEVAKIVAETMDNYLMCKRLLSAKYISPEDQHGFYFKGKNWTETNYPTLKNRKVNLRKNRSEKSEESVLASSKKYLKQIRLAKEKLKAVGIDYDLKPVDVPEELNMDKKSEVNISDSSEKENSDTPALEIDESEDSDIMFNLPAGVKKIVKKSKSDKIIGKKVEKKSKIENLPVKKLKSISKKTKVAKNVPVEKNSKKVKLLQSSLADKNQFQMKTAQDIKKKKLKQKKSPK